MSDVDLTATAPVSPPFTPVVPADASGVNVTAAGGTIPSTLAQWQATGPVSASNTLVTATGSTTARTLAEMANDTVNLRGNGCACDGVTNDYAALAALVTRLGATKKTLVVPGPCKVGTAISIPGNLTVRFADDGHFDGSVTYTGLVWMPPEATAQYHPRAPIATSFVSAQASGSGYTYDDVYRWFYNGDPNNGIPAFSSDEPCWSEQFESRYTPSGGAGSLERMWVYTSIDRATTYRPMMFWLDLATHLGIIDWTVDQFWVGRPGATQTLVVKTTSGAEQFDFYANGAHRFTVGGHGNVEIMADQYYSFNMRSNDPATVGVPVYAGPLISSFGTYWDGAASQYAGVGFQAEVQGNNVYNFRMYVGSKNWRFKNDGRLEMVNGMYLRMQSPDNSWWKISVANGGTLAISAD